MASCKLKQTKANGTCSCALRGSLEPCLGEASGMIGNICRHEVGPCKIQPQIGQMIVNRLAVACDLYMQHASRARFRVNMAFAIAPLG